MDFTHPTRKHAPVIGTLAVLLVLGLGACSKSPEEIKAAKAKVEAETTGRLVVKSNRANTVVEATRIPAAGEPASAGVKGLEEGAAEQTLSRLPPGKYAVVARAEGWPEVRAEATVEVGRATDVAINFKSGSLRLDSVPTGATVKLGSAVLGKTPLVIPQLPPGPCALSFEYPSWPVVSLKVTIAEGVESSETVRLPHGTLKVETVPAGATVMLGGKAVGQTPLTLERVPAGAKKLQVQAKDFPALNVAATVEDRGEATVSLQLGSYLPALDAEALFRGTWVPDDPNRIVPPDGTTGPFQPQNGIVKNLNRKRLHQTWLNKRYHFSAIMKSYDPATGKVEFVDQENAFSKYRVVATLTPDARKDPVLAVPPAKGTTLTLSLYGLLTAVEEPRWPAKVIRFEISAADLLH